MSDRTLQVVETERDYLADCLQDIHTRAVDESGTSRSLTDDEQTAWDDGKAALEQLTAEIQRFHDLADLATVRAAAPSRVEPDPDQPVFDRRDGETFGRERSLSNDVANDAERALNGQPSSLRDSVRRLLDNQWGDHQPGRNRAEELLTGKGISDGNRSSLRGANLAALHMAVYGTDGYREAFGTLIKNTQSNRVHPMSTEAQRALDLADRFREMNVTTPGDGGLQVPTHLNPTIRLMDLDYQDGVTMIARHEVLTGGANIWNGISSAGVTVEYVAESASVADASPALNGLSIPTVKGDIYVESTIEYDQDVGLAGQLNALFDDAMARNAADVFISGNGTTEPLGIEVALDALTNSEVATDTTLVVDADDIRDLLFTELPAGFRGRASWVMNDAIRAHIHSFADGSGTLGLFTTNFTQAVSESLLGRPVYSASSMGADSTPAVGADVAIVGDFSNYVIVHKLDSMLQYLPIGLDPTTNRPNGQVGWVMWFRHGAGLGSTNNTAAGPGNAFRLLNGA